MFFSTAKHIPEAQTKINHRFNKNVMIFCLKTLQKKIFC